MKFEVMGFLENTVRFLNRSLCFFPVLFYTSTSFSSLNFWSFITCISNYEYYISFRILSKKKKKKASISIVNDENSQDTPLALLNKSNDDDIPLSKIVKDSAPSKAQKKQNVLITSTNNNNTITDANIKNAPNLTGTAKTEGSPFPKIEAGPDKKAELSGTDSPKPNLKVETPLPENLAKELLEDVARLKQTAADKTKGKFFTPEVNKVLVRYVFKKQFFLRNKDTLDFH